MNLPKLSSFENICGYSDDDVFLSSASSSCTFVVNGVVVVNIEFWSVVDGCDADDDDEGGDENDGIVVFAFE